MKLASDAQLGREVNMVPQHLNAIAEHIGKARESAVMERYGKVRAELDAIQSYVDSLRRNEANRAIRETKRENLLVAYEEYFRAIGLPLMSGEAPEEVAS